MWIICIATGLQVLREFALHHETGEPIPEHIANQIIKSKSLYLASVSSISNTSLVKF